MHWISIKFLRMHYWLKNTHRTSKQHKASTLGSGWIVWGLELQSWSNWNDGWLEEIWRSWGNESVHVTHVYKNTLWEDYRKDEDSGAMKECMQHIFIEILHRNTIREMIREMIMHIYNDEFVNNLLSARWLFCIYFSIK